jgi:hypothetical protein
MTRSFGNPKELLYFLESSGILHKMIRRNNPGHADDGLISSSSYRVCEEVPLTRYEECLGCIARKLLDEEG